MVRDKGTSKEAIIQDGTEPIASYSRNFEVGVGGDIQQLLDEI